MAETFFESLREILSIQRWNFVPRIDDWSEAENIAYYTHLAYAISMVLKIEKDDITKILCRCLLKSFNKHRLSDIPIDTRDAIKQQNETAWANIIADAASHTSKLFPRELRSFISIYMQYEFINDGKSAPLQEEIIKYSQYQSALEECESNLRVFPIDKYERIRNSITCKMGRLDQLERIKSAHKDIRPYAGSIFLLKHVRRWNRLNRTIQSSVLAHTFVVAILALVFAKLENSKIPLYEAIVRALFHDVQESITGDIITPVKDIINRQASTLWEAVENQMKAGFMSIVPPVLNGEIEAYKLLRLSDNPPMNTAESLVKECDRFALVLECVFEGKGGNRQAEMVRAQLKYIQDLKNSEWPRIREFAGIVVDEYGQ